MKKTLLLSVVASTMIMAGGDIAPVEPVVEAAPVEASAWEFSGQAVAYLQTRDALGGTQNGDLFGGNTTATGLGLQLRATNADIFAGIGFGAEVSTIQDGKSANVSNTHFGIARWFCVNTSILDLWYGQHQHKLESWSSNTSKVTFTICIL